MADSAVPITAGSGTNIDTRTEGTNGNHRQVIVIGDPSTNAGVAPVDATNGLSVDVKASALPTGAATSAKQDTGNTSLATIAGAVSGTEMQVDVLTMPSTAVTNAGLTALNGAISGTEVQVDIVGSLPAGTNAIGKLSANSGVDIGDVDVTSLPSIPAGNNNIGDVDVASIAAGTNLIGQVNVAPQTANGLSVFNATSSDGATALTNTAQAIKASAGQVYGWYIYNPNSSAQFVQFYNTAAGSVTVGTTNPLFMLTIPATSAANVEFTNGITFSNAGFSCAATSTAGGNGAPATALDVVIFYK